MIEKDGAHQLLQRKQLLLRSFLQMSMADF
jgi:hypothetical protein